MIQKNSNMWQDWEAVDLFIITTNSFITKEGKLVMGRGIAAQARDKFPDLDIELGKFISKKCGHLGRYGFEPPPSFPKAKMGIFQVKYNWRDRADLELIKLSANMLDFWLLERNIKVALNFPGIGNGKLSEKDVLPLIEFLPDKVAIYRI